MNLQLASVLLIEIISTLNANPTLEGYEYKHGKTDSYDYHENNDDLIIKTKGMSNIFFFDLTILLSIIYSIFSN